MENLLNERISTPIGLKKLALVEDISDMTNAINENKRAIQDLHEDFQDEQIIVQDSFKIVNEEMLRVRNVVEPQVEANARAADDLYTKFYDVNGEITSLKNSVSDGKSKVAAAITSKGIDTSATETFDNMANNILAIQSSSLEEDTADGNITSEDVLSGKIGYSQGNRIIGSMPAITGEDHSLVFNGTYNIPKGYHDGTGKVIQNLTNRGAISYTLPINGTYTIPEGYHNGQGKVTQSVTNNGAVSYSLPINGTYTIPAGYHNGSGKVTQSITTKGTAYYTPGTTTQTISSGRYLTGNQYIYGDSNLIPENIKKGVIIFATQGTYTGTGGLNSTIGQDATYIYSQVDISIGETSYTIPYNGKILMYSLEFRGKSSNPNMYCAAAPGLGWIQNTTVFVVKDFYNIDFGGNQDYVPYYLPTVKITNSGKTLNFSYSRQNLSNYVSYIYIDYAYIPN